MILSTIGPVSAVLMEGPEHGTVQLNSNGSFTYAPSLNYNGNAHFSGYDAKTGELAKSISDVSYSQLSAAEQDSFDDTGWSQPKLLVNIAA